MKLLNQILNKISSKNFNQVCKSTGALSLIASAMSNDQDILNSFCVLAFDEVPNKNFSLKEYVSRKADSVNGLNLVQKHLIAKEVSKYLKDASAFYDSELAGLIETQDDFKRPESVKLIKSAHFGDVAFVNNKYHLVNPITKNVTAEFIVAAADANFAKLHELIGEARKAGYVDSVVDLDGDLVVTTRPNVSYELANQIKELGYDVEEIDQTNYEDPETVPTYNLRIKMSDGNKPADIVNEIPKEESVNDDIEKSAKEKIDFEKDLMEAGESEGAKDKVNETQLEMGKEVEKEHTTNPEIAEKITRDHLAEIPDYYTHLKEMEDNAKTNDAVEKKADATDSKDGYTLEEGNDYYQIFKNNEKGTFRIWDIGGNGWEDTQEYTDIASAEKEIENLAEGLPEKLEDGVVNSDDKEEKQGIKYSVNLWPGNGYQTKEFKAYATSEEDALDNVVQYLVDNDLDQYFLTEEDVKRMAVEEGISEDELKDKPAFNEKYMYIDTGMGAQVYLLTENMKINKDVSEVKSSYAPFITIDATNKDEVKVIAGEKIVWTCKDVKAAFEKSADWSSEELLIDDGTGVTVTYQVYDDESELPVVWAALRHRDNGNVIMCSDAAYVGDLLGAEDHIDFLKDIKDFSKEFAKIGLDEEKVQHYQDQTNAKLKEIFQPQPGPEGGAAEVVESAKQEEDINKKADQELKQFDMKQELDGQKEFEKQDDFSQVSVPEEKEDTSEVTETMEAKPEETKGESFSASEFGNNLAYIQQNNPDAFKSIMNNLKQIMVGDEQKIYNFLENWASHNFQDFTAMTREDPSYARHSQYQEQLKNNVLPKLKEMSEYKKAMEEKVSAEKGNVEASIREYDSSDPEDAALYNGEDEEEED